MVAGPAQAPRVSVAGAVAPAPVRGVSPAPPQPVSPARPSAPAPTGTHSAGFDVTAMLHAAGVDPATVPPETAGALGLILRSVVQGVIEVLQARAEIKNQFRLPLTRVKTAENNPLKFAVNAEDALSSLLGRRNPAYLAPLEAFEDAFNDIRFHQMAMLAGMRAGFEHVIGRFDPQRLQEVFDKQVKRGGLLSMTSKSRYWELYAEEFRELTGDQDEAFRRLFGEEFASAYEKQLDGLKRSRNKPHR
jgi:type VI secretion system FHA domain protein